MGTLGLRGEGSGALRVKWPPRPLADRLEDDMISTSPRGVAVAERLQPPRAFDAASGMVVD